MCRAPLCVHAASTLDAGTRRNSSVDCREVGATVDHATLIAREEEARAAYMAKVQRIVAQGGRLAIHADRINQTTHLVESARDADGTCTMAPRHCGELWVETIIL